jgi:hypothetical protein
MPSMMLMRCADAVSAFSVALFFVSFLSRLRDDHRAAGVGSRQAAAAGSRLRRVAAVTGGSGDGRRAHSTLQRHGEPEAKHCEPSQSVAAAAVQSSSAPSCLLPSAASVSSFQQPRLSLHALAGFLAPPQCHELSSLSATVSPA